MMHSISTILTPCIDNLYVYTFSFEFLNSSIICRFI